MNKSLNLKLFGLLISCTGLILIFSYMGTSAYETVMNERIPVFSKGTMISTISLEGLTKEEAEIEVANRIQEWSKASSFSLHYQNQTAELPDNMIAFDVIGSIQGIVDGGQADLIVSVDPAILEETINGTFENKAIVKDLDIDKLVDALLDSVQLLQADSTPLQLLSYLKTDGEVGNKELTVGTIKGIASQAKNLEALLANLDQIEIAANETFSFENEFGSNQSESAALNMIASAIYEAILPTNFMIVERNISKELPAYNELGFEAKVNDKMDLVFNNPNPYSYKLTFQLVKDRLEVKLMGPPFPYQYSIRKETESFSPKTVLQFSAKLSPTETKVLEKGKKALLAKVYREAKDDNDQVIETTFISEDFYPPVHRIEQVGLLPSEANNNENNNEVTTSENYSDDTGEDSEQAGPESEKGNSDLNGTNMAPADTNVEKPS